MQLGFETSQKTLIISGTLIVMFEILHKIGQKSILLLFYKGIPSICTCNFRCLVFISFKSLVILLIKFLKNPK